MIEINKQALELTKQACHEELNTIQKKYNTSFIQTVFQCLRKKIIQLVIFSLFAMFFIIISSQKSVEDSISVFIIYYASLGALAIFEYMHSDYYRVRDILSLGYLNEGRRFLFASCLFTIIEVLNFITVCIFIPMTHFDFIKTVLCALIPILISQIISIYFIQYVRNLFGTITAYLLSYLGVSFFFLVNDFYQMISTQTVFILLGIVGVGYIFTVMFITKQRKGIKDIWNWS